MTRAALNIWRGGRIGVQLYLAAGLAFTAILPTSAGAADRQAAFVVDANTGQVVSSYKADEPRYPASLTKLMTLYIVFDLIERGRLTYNTPIIITERAAAAQPTKLDLPPGTEIALVDAVRALVTHSANDVAISIAEHIAGSEEKFANLMTQRAHQIGMTGSTFKNASGLPNSEQFTTARDMVTLGLRLQDDFPVHYKVFSTRSFAYNGHTYANHNTMLGSYEGTEGIKTGYTTASGFNLVASVRRGQKHVVGAVFGGTSASSRNLTMRTLLNMALFKASSHHTRVPLVARLNGRPVPEPKLAERPAQPVLVASNGVAGPGSWSTAVVTPAPAAAVPEPAIAPSKVEIARVRPVLVAPGPSRTIAAAPSPQPPVRMASAEPPAVVASNVAASAPAEFKLPPLASAAAPQITRPKAAIVAPLPQTQTAVMPAAASARGNAPSTLQQQAANLSGSAAPTYRLNGPPPASPAAVEIQIGAYTSAAEAQRHLELTRSKAADLIGRAPGVTHPTTANGRPLWRARFSGFDVSAAGGVCTELRRRQIDCLVAKSE